MHSFTTSLAPPFPLLFHPPLVETGTRTRNVCWTLVLPTPPSSPLTPPSSPLPAPTTTTSRFHPRVVFQSSLSREKLAVDAVAGVDGAGAARRRRKRRLRSMLRHERQTVAMEVTAALHQGQKAASSAGGRPDVLAEQAARSSTPPRSASSRLLRWRPRGRRRLQGRRKRLQFWGVLVWNAGGRPMADLAGTSAARDRQLRSWL